MNRIAYWIFGVGLILLFMAAFFVYQQFSAPTPSTGTDTPYTDPFGTSDNYIPYPNGNTSQKTLTLQTSDGGTIMVRDFLRDAATLEDTANSGHYYLGNSIDPTIDTPPSFSYVIVYNASAQSFSASLLREPLGRARQEAEQYLMRSLGIAEQDMCLLKYVVSVPGRVNTEYVGTNLGWSFCSGAIQLP